MEKYTITLFILLAFSSSLALAARSNICLAAGTQVYKPLQLYPSDCPNNASNCMAAVYNYKPALFKSQGPTKITPANTRLTYVYMSQDESDNLDVVVISATTYSNTNINTKIQVTGAETGTAYPLVLDDPTEDTWNWTSATNTGNFTWILQPYYTDGVVLGHFKLIDNYCFRVSFNPNWVNALGTVSFLTGNVTHPKVVVSKAFAPNTFFEFCQYPQALITKTDVGCNILGSASVTILNQTDTPTYLWTKDGVTVGTTQTITDLTQGTYTVAATSAGCTVYRDVTIGSSLAPIVLSAVSTPQTSSVLGSIVLTITGGNPPYSSVWKDALDNVVGTNVTTLQLPSGTYTIEVTDRCGQKETITSTIDPPYYCPAGSRFNSVTDPTGCVACVPGTYAPLANSPTCQVCPPGKWNNVYNATSCTTCAANTYTTGGSDSCTACGTNYYSAAGSGVCTPCAPGTQRTSAQTSCTACASGTFRCDLGEACEPCPVGTFSASGATVCEACNPGTSQSTTGQANCSGCPVNTYAAHGAAACTACPSGKVAPALSTVLVACI